jgi:hypothetical protein
MLLGLLVLGGVSAAGCQTDAQDADITYPPEGFTAKAASSTQVNLAWTGTNADYYYVLVSMSTGTTNPTGVETVIAGSDGDPTEVDNTSFTFKSVTATRYCFQVEGVAQAIPSGPSDEVCVKTP